MYTPRKNMWLEIFPACDTRLQCHRYDATVAWGCLEEAPARKIPIPQARRRPSPTGTMASPGSKPGKNGKLCLNPGVFPGWGPGCTQSFPGACGEGCGCVTVCTGHCLQGGGSRRQARALLLKLPPGVDSGTRILVQSHLTLTWLETSATGRCSLAACPPLGTLASRNPRDATCSNAVGFGSAIKANASGHLSGALCSCCGDSCTPPAAAERSSFCLRSNSQAFWWLQHRLHIPSVPPLGERASAMKWNLISPTKPSWMELLEHEVRQLLPALLRRDIISIFSFLENYNEFASTEEVLDLLFTKYGCIVAAYCDNDAALQWWKMAISCILDIWLEYYQEDFHQLPEFPSLTKLLEFMRQRMPGSDLEHRALCYLKLFRHLHAVEPEAREQHPESPQEPAPAPTVAPAAPSGPEVIEQVLAAGAEGLARTEIPAAESKPLKIVVTGLFHCSTLEEPLAPSASPEEDHHLPPEQLASTPEQHPEPPQEPAPAPTAGLVMATAQRRLAHPCHFTVSIF
ncbi:unnamed protein product [Nyctereutes procyonoides]|uniref:(raccoon dog) hypothetical protein n=1 Tax=Nyctereutes procyonoides TaxID=34880 RepID=A0A811YS47_NYCPR|nr:unnamed protein product [Nyctereutes procyonoides]